jgi:formylglycine-generating enzyme required for sulfatase activity
MRRKSVNHCPPEDRLQRLIDGELPPTEFEPVEAHLEHCPVCQSTLDRLTAFADTAWLVPRAALARRTAPVAPAIPGFHLQGEVGRGGHGVVYRAWQPDLERLVAIKVLRAGAFSTTAERHRFLAEARSAARLGHPNIVRVFAVSEADAIPYSVMEWVDGGNLAARLAGTPLPSQEAAGVVAIVARGVQHAHEAGVIHRDLKPANVLLHDGTLTCPAVTDFGMAKRLDVRDGLTPTVEVLGTPSYIAPEVAAGHAREAGPAVDIYALGAILYECLTGRPPFKGETPFQTLRQVLEVETVPPRRLVPTVPIDLETICLKCLRKNPTDRYPTAVALAEDLDRFSQGRPVLARPPRVIERVAAWARRRPRLAAAVGGAVSLLLVAVTLLWWSGTQVRAAEDQTKARTMSEAIATAEVAHVTKTIGQLGDLRPLAVPHIRQLYESAPTDSRQRLNLALALLPDEPGLVDELTRRALVARPDELLVIRDALAPHTESLAPKMWAALTDTESSRSAVLRAAGLLAGWEPEDGRWGLVAERVADALLAENPLNVGPWATVLRPARRPLVSALAAAGRCSTRLDGQRTSAAAVVADYAHDDPEFVADLLVEATPGQFAQLLAVLRPDDERVKTLLRGVLNAPTPPTDDERVRDAHADRAARAAIGLFHLGDHNPVWTLLGQGGPDQRRRTATIHALPALGIPPTALVDRLAVLCPDHERRGLVFALGGYEPSAIDGQLVGRLRDQLLPVYRDDPDPGVHAAAGWLLRTRLGAAKAVEQADDLARVKPVGERKWSVSSTGMPMAHLGPCPLFTVGTQKQLGVRNTTEPRMPCRIPYQFALATREVTVREFAEFLRDHKVGYQPPEGPDPLPDEPVRGVTWYQAAAFCRWLSEKERISPKEWCYPAVTDLKPGVDLVPGFVTRTGYRLPTEFEWEYACRVGTDTPRAYGFSPALLERYAWYLGNSDDHPGPVAVKLPNDFGLFDMYGNAWEWTQPAPWKWDAASICEAQLDDPKPTVSGENGPYCPVARGGSFLYHVPFIRSAKRYPTPPTKADSTIGFRIARTLPTGG